MHKRCTSDGLGDRYYLEQINNMVNGAEAAHHQRRESATQLYNKYRPANDPFNGVKYHYSADVSQLIHDLLQIDDRKRISASEVLEKYHDWFVSHDAVIF